MALRNEALVTGALTTVLWSTVRAAEPKGSNPGDWQMIKDILDWVWHHLHDFATWLGTHMVIELWRLLVLWSVAVLFSVIVLVWALWRFTNRTWWVEDRANRLEWMMLRHPRSWAYSDLRADAKQLKEVVGGPYHYECGGEIRFTPSPQLGADVRVCSRCDRARFDIGPKGTAPAAHDRLAVGREMQRLYRISKQQRKRWPPAQVITLDWTAESSGKNVSK
jgi:hypothetical protein